MTNLYKQILIAIISRIDNVDDLQSLREGVTLNYARRIVQEASDQEELPWTEFKQAVAQSNETMVKATIQRFPQHADAIRRMLTQNRVVWVNSRYQVVRNDLPNGSVHLSIKRIDQAPIRDWRDLQRIKNELLGPECEAVELYPAESRCVDMANQYHLWGTADGYRFPVGFPSKMKSVESFGGAIQRTPEK